MSAPSKYTSNLNNKILLILVYHSLCGINAAYCYLNSYTPTEILNNINRTCFFLLNTRSNIQQYESINYLSTIYINDQDVTVGTIDTEHFLWPNGENLRLKGQINEPFISNENEIVFFTRQKTDRSCIVKHKIEWNPLAEIYTGHNSVDSMNDFLNEKCNAYRDNKGKLTIQGIHRETIKTSLFKLSSVSNVTMGLLYKNSNVSPSFYQNIHLKVDKENNEKCAINHVCKSSDNLHEKYKYSQAANTPLTIPKCERIQLPLNQNEFYHSFLKKSKPVIIENAINTWPAFQKWTNKYLRNKYGGNEVHVKLTPGGDFEGVEKAESWDNYNSFKMPDYVRSQLPYPDLVVVRPAAVNMNFSDFLDHISWASEQRNRNVSAYLEYSSIPNYMPELEEDLIEFPFATVLKRAHLNMWLSDGHTLGRLHFDPYDNFLCQFRGKKQVLMFEPHDNSKLYEAHIPQATLSYNKTTKQFRRHTLEDSTSMVMSPVDILNPDFKRFPKFADTLPLNCTITEGDVLYMPAFWWHEVYSWPNITERRNLAVNFWYEPFLEKEFPCAECKMDVNPLYRHLL